MSIRAPRIGLSNVLRCSVPTLAGLLFGYNLGWIAGVLAMRQFNYDFGKGGLEEENSYLAYSLSSSDTSLITSILSAGTLCGAVSAGCYSDRCGRWKIIVVGNFIYLIGVVMELSANGSIPLLTGGRAIAGLGIGLVSATTIIYASEICPKQIRGLVLGAYQMLITVGLFLAACVSFGSQKYPSMLAYNIPISVQIGLSFMLAFGMTFMPESPRWCVFQGREVEAKKSLAFIWCQDPDSSFIKQEFDALLASYLDEVNSGAIYSTFMDCFRGGLNRGSNLHRTLIGTSIQMFQQLNGFNFIFYYGTTFFQLSTVSDPFVISMVVSGVNVASTPVALWAMETFGRRRLLIIGAIGMAICEFMVAVIGSMSSYYRSYSDHFIGFVSVFIFFFAITWGPCAWAVCGEIHPRTTRSQSTSLSTASNWFWNFVVAFVAPYLIDDQYAGLGAKIFFIFGAFTTAGAIYAFFFIYETQGMSLEDIDTMMKECSARSSPTWDARDGIVRISASWRNRFFKWFRSRRQSETRPGVFELQ